MVALSRAVAFGMRLGHKGRPPSLAIGLSHPKQPSRWNFKKQPRLSVARSKRLRDEAHESGAANQPGYRLAAGGITGMTNCKEAGLTIHPPTHEQIESPGKDSSPNAVTREHARTT